MRRLRLSQVRALACDHWGKARPPTRADLAQRSAKRWGRQQARLMEEGRRDKTLSPPTPSRRELQSYRLEGRAGRGSYNVIGGVLAARKKGRALLPLLPFAVICFALCIEKGEGARGGQRGLLIIARPRYKRGVKGSRGAGGPLGCSRLLHPVAAASRRPTTPCAALRSPATEEEAVE